ncbi:MAG: hypothetical protein IKJ84_04935, partial [Oscillospiraceae bacterium]|nr:hypothetical protein [Oscillospiraceae bacterium]
LYGFPEKRFRDKGSFGKNMVARSGTKSNAGNDKMFCILDFLSGGQERVVIWGKKCYDIK